MGTNSGSSEYRMETVGPKPRQLEATGLLELRELRLHTVDTDVQVANLVCFLD
jgi:hypothetical protein